MGTAASHIIFRSARRCRRRFRRLQLQQPLYNRVLGMGLPPDHSHRRRPERMLCLVDIGVPLLEERKEVVVWKGRLPRAHAEDDDKPRQARPRQRRWGHGGGVVYVSKRSARKYWR